MHFRENRLRDSFFGPSAAKSQAHAAFDGQEEAVVTTPREEQGNRFVFEDFGLVPIKDFRVEPERKDTVEVLERNLKKFVDNRSWPPK